MFQNPTLPAFRGFLLEAGRLELNVLGVTFVLRRDSSQRNPRNLAREPGFFNTL